MAWSVYGVVVSQGKRASCEPAQSKNDPGVGVELRSRARWPPATNARAAAFASLRTPSWIAWTETRELRVEAYKPCPDDTRRAKLDEQLDELVGSTQPLLALLAGLGHLCVAPAGYRFPPHDVSDEVVSSRSCNNEANSFTDALTHGRGMLLCLC